MRALEWGTPPLGTEIESRCEKPDLCLIYILSQKGAFSIATKAKMPIVPITLVGTGKLMPSGKEGSLRSGGVKIIVHPPITGTDPNQLMADSREIIYNTLVEYGAEQ